MFFLFLSPELFQILIQVCFSPSTMSNMSPKNELFQYENTSFQPSGSLGDIFLWFHVKKRHIIDTQQDVGQISTLGVSENSGTPKSSILIGFSIINHPFWGTPYFWKQPTWSLFPPRFVPPLFRLPTRTPVPTADVLERKWCARLTPAEAWEIQIHGEGGKLKRNTTRWWMMISDD